MVDDIGRQAPRGPGHGSTQGRKEPADLFWQAAEGRGLASTSAAPLSSPGVRPIPAADRALEHVLGCPGSMWPQPHVVLVVTRRPFPFPFPSTSQKSSKESQGNPGRRSPSWAQSCSRHGVPRRGAPTLQWVDPALGARAAAVDHFGGCNTELGYKEAKLTTACPPLPRNAVCFPPGAARESEHVFNCRGGTTSRCFEYLCVFLLVCDVVRVAGSEVWSFLFCVRGEKVITCSDRWVSVLAAAVLGRSALVLEELRTPEAPWQGAHGSPWVKASGSAPLPWDGDGGG